MHQTMGERSVDVLSEVETTLPEFLKVFLYLYEELFLMVHHMGRGGGGG